MSLQKDDHPSLKVLYTGMSGTGKTTLAQKRIAKEKARWKFIFDHKNGEFARRYGYQSVYTGDEILQATAKGGVVCFDPIREWHGRFPAAFKFWCEYVFTACRELQGRKLFIVDELQRVQTTNKEPEELLSICDVGRTFQIDCFFISSAPNAIHNRVRGQLTETFAFRLVEKNSLKFLEENNFDPEKIRTLPNGCYHFRNFDTSEAKEGGEAF